MVPQSLPATFPEHRANCGRRSVRNPTTSAKAVGTTSVATATRTCLARSPDALSSSCTRKTQSL